MSKPIVIDGGTDEYRPIVIGGTSEYIPIVIGDFGSAGKHTGDIKGGHGI